MEEKQKIRVLVVDDSAYNRRNIAEILAQSGEAEVIGKAMDGEEALRQTLALKPDVITLDLEMPRMDGFTFLRILMAKQPTPVIVVSSYSQRDNVFKALELGALEFIAKPERQLAADPSELRHELLQKLQIVRLLHRGLSAQRPSRTTTRNLALVLPEVPPRWLIGIASSTGGPSALLEIFGNLQERLPAGIVVAQHMPDKFTRTFAERLDKRGPFRVAEAQHGDALVAGSALVCPGRQCMEVTVNGQELRVRVLPPAPGDRYVPSADRLLRSVAEAYGRRAVAVILTGMGDDGLAGARAIHEAGGLVVVESPETAVVNGMPGAVHRAGLAHHVLPLPDIANFLLELMGS
ncbi:MAG: chemotaxis-specific protein-glutamate methyltransferase CheB [Myxococcales bacterium]|nr:chemotaxis-specific protein-glutamate methyltransferase CheB [Polyangiaceae bacterium]MDW8248474.1 chemotaxis-specific protein-glutamate methyltransferase CheB [Myxococcales bacterium]